LISGQSARLHSLVWSELLQRQRRSSIRPKCRSTRTAKIGRSFETGAPQCSFLKADKTAVYGVNIYARFRSAKKNGIFLLVAVDD
jgi:hypothetical protein